MNADDVGAFLDGIVPQELARENIAGAVVSVVKDGKVLFAKGYGYSDVKKNMPVSATDTLFRPDRLRQALYLDGGHATGGAGQTRPGPGRQRLS